MSTPSSKSSNSSTPRSDKTEKEGKVKLDISDFEIMRLLGKGAYGEVYLARQKSTKKLLALKQMGKELIKASGKSEHIKNEKKILTEGKSTYLVKMFLSFQTSDCLYLGMEYCPGGDLREFLSVIQYLEEPEAVLYFAEMIMAVNYLHNMNYIHRDLKPDNFLIDNRGHLKLADFGLSKSTAQKNASLAEAEATKQKYRYSLLPEGTSCDKLTENNFNTRFRSGSSTIALEGSRTMRASMKPLANRRLAGKTVVGSPDYMSPEVTAGLAKEDNTYGSEVDWWSLGCVFFEMIIGTTPFEGDSPDEIFECINNWRAIVPQVLKHYQNNMSPEFYSLVKGFLCDPVERLGPDLRKLQKHTFFIKHKLDWQHLSTMEPPFVPNNVES